MLIKLDKELIKYTGFKNEVTVEGEYLNEAILNLFDKYPQFYAFFLCNEGEEANKTTMSLNGEYLIERDCLWRKVADSDVLEFKRDIPEGAGAIGKIIAGVVIIAAAVVATVMTEGAAAPSLWEAMGSFGQMVSMFGASLILGGVGELLIGQPNLPTDGNSSSSTYTFNGIHNTTVSGTPIPIVYGRHRVGGHILNAYVSTEGATSFLYAQIGLSEGQIYEVEHNSIKINERYANNFDDVTVYYRAGDSENAVGTGKPGVLIAPARSSSDYPMTTPIILKGGSSVDRYVMTGVKNASKIKIVIACKTGVAVGSQIPIMYTIPRIHIEDGSGNLLTPVGVPVTDDPDATIVTKVFDLSVSNYTGTAVIVVELSGVIPNPVTLAQYSVINTDLEEVLNANPVMYGFNRIENSISYNLHIPTEQVANPNVMPPIQADENIGAIISTQQQVSMAEVTITAPALYKTGDKGAIGTSVVFRVFYRKSLDDNKAWTEYAPVNPLPRWNTVESVVASKTPISKVVPMVFPTVDYYDIKVVRWTLTPETTWDVNVQDAIYLKEINEIVFGDLVYPCTALLGARIKATDNLSGGMPTITSIVKGVMVDVPSNYTSVYDPSRGVTKRYTTGTWDGTMKKAWTDNPVWCLYDLLTNERYGLGKEFRILESRRNSVMLPNFYAMAQYCDTYVKDDGSIAVPEDPEGRPRFSLNLVIDQQKSAREWVNIICASMRATLFNCEGIVFLDIDRPKAMTQIFNMSNISSYTQSSMSYKAIPNTYLTQFPNKDKDFVMDAFTYDTARLQASPDVNPVPQNIDLVGVTSSKDARSLTLYTANKIDASVTNVSFKTGTQLLMSTVLDVIGIQHDVPMWGSGGRITSVVNNILPSPASMLSQHSLASTGATAQLTDLGSNMSNGVAYLKFTRTGTSGSDFRFYSPNVTFDKTQSYVYSIDCKVLQNSSEIWLMGNIVDNQPNTQYKLCSLNATGPYNVATGVTVLSVTSPDTSGYRRVSLQLNPSIFTGSGSVGKIGFFHGWSTLGTWEAYYTRPQLEVGTVANTFVDGCVLGLSSDFGYASDKNTNGDLYGDLSIAISQDGQPPVTLSVVTPSVGSHSSVTVTPQAGFTPRERDVYILNFSTNTVKPFKIVALQRDTDEFITVNAVEYNESIYSDDITRMADITARSYSTLPVNNKESVEGFKVEKAVSLDLSKTLRMGVDVWYTVPTNLYWSGVRVAYKADSSDTYKYTELDRTGHVFISEPITTSESYTFIGLSYWKDGSQQTVEQCLNDPAKHPYETLYIDASIPNDTFGKNKVSGLETDGYNDGSFVGKDCKVKWKPIVAVDSMSNGEATNDPAGQEQTDQLLAYYKVTVSNTDGTIRRSVRVYEPQFTYTHDLNAADGLKRQFDITVTAVDVFGRASLPSVIRCTNPTPPAIA